MTSFAEQSTEHTDWRLALQKQGYTQGLIHQVERTITEIPLRIWILDNSASMNIHDAHRLIGTPTSKEVRTVKCTRWQELVEAVRYHAQLAALIKTPTIFRLLNPYPNIPSEYSIAEQPIFDNKDMHRQLSCFMKSICSIQPTGVTPLTAHIYEIRQAVLSMDQSMRGRNQRVSLIIATDGLPSNEKGCSGAGEIQLFINALRMLENLSIGIVIRLCTNEEKVKEFYYNLRRQMKLTIHVVEDFMSEAEKINRFNPWITYALPVHRVREFGVINSFLAALKDHVLTTVEVRGYCTVLFGSELIASVPDPIHDIAKFVKMIKCITRRDRRHRTRPWDPRRKKFGYLLDTELLGRAFGHDETCCTIS